MHQLHIEAITEEFIFYAISPHHLQKFQQLASELSFPTIPSSSTLDVVNPFITAANIWFSLHMHQDDATKHFYLDEQRRVAYNAAYFQLEYIERHRAIRSFLTQHSDAQCMVILAYTLSIHCMNWLLRVMDEANHLKTVEYYLDEENVKKGVHTQYEDEHQARQKKYMKAIIENIQQEDGLNMAIQHAIRDAHAFLKHIQIS